MVHMSKQTYVQTFGSASPLGGARDTLPAFMDYKFTVAKHALHPGIVCTHALIFVAIQ